MAVDLVTTMTGAEMNTALTGAHDGKRKAYTAAQISGLNPATWGTGDVLRDDGLRFRSNGSAFIELGYDDTAIQTDLNTKPDPPANVANTVSAVDLSNPLGTYKTDVAINVGSMILGAVVTGGFQVQMINATSEPSISGATKITGSAFVANTDMYMVCCNNGSRSEYHFQEL